MVRDDHCSDDRNRSLRNQRHIKWPSRRISRRGADRSIAMALTTGMTRRHHRRSTFLRHFQAAVMFCLGHGADWDHTRDRRRCSPKDCDCQHRQRTRSRHTHILQVPVLCKHARPALFLSVIEITGQCEEWYWGKFSDGPTTERPEALRSPSTPFSSC